MENPLESPLEAIRQHVAGRYQQLEDNKQLKPLVAATRRFFDVEGLDLAGLLALELFTTIIPLVLLGYSYLADFNKNLNFGDFMVRWLDLKGTTADRVHDLFGATADLKSTWTVLGIAGFLFWGIPMSSQVAKTFARAFKRERFPFWTEVWRGSVWFVLLLVTQAATVALTTARAHTVWTVLLNVIGLVPSVVLWSLSPPLLVRNGTTGWKHMVWCGLAGLVLDVVGVRITLRFVLPKLLNGWVSFGPIGVAMGLMTTCTVIATLWVATACLGAVMWERFAPADMVIDTQFDPSRPVAPTV